MKTRQNLIIILAIIHSLLPAGAQQVNTWLVMGPLPVDRPGFVKGKNIFGEPFGENTILANEYLNLDEFHPAKGDPLLWDDYRPRTWYVEEVMEDGFVTLKPEKSKYQIAYHGFYIESGGLYEYACEVESPQMFEVFLDGKKVDTSYAVAGEDETVTKTTTLDLDRGKFLVLVKSMYIKGGKNKWKLRASLSSEEDTVASLDVSPLTRMNVHHLLEGTKLGSLALSADGTLIAVNYSRINMETGKAAGWTEIKEVATGKTVQSFRKSGTTGYKWTPMGRKLYYTTESENGSTVMVHDFETGTEYPVLENIEDLSGVTWSEDEKFIFYYRTEEKPSDAKSALRYMDYLQNRTFPPKSVSDLYRYNVNTGVSTRLSFGERSVILNDVSPDGNRILFATVHPDPTRPPFNFQHMYLMDLQSGRTDTLWKDFHWDGMAEFSPDGRQLLVIGGPDMFDGIGRNIGDQHVANNTDMQVFIFDLSTWEADPISKDFNPSIKWAHWHAADNRIYLKVVDQVYVRLYRWDGETRSFSMIPTVPDVVDAVTISEDSLKIGYTGVGNGQPNKAWILDLESDENRLFDRTEERAYRNVSFGESEDWDFTTSDGTVIKGYFHYPRNFDSTRKYPLIVNYYAGTNPVKKDFGGRYPRDIWAGEDYVVYVPQPSGAIGFGQEFSARHQNNWGKTTAGEIIEGTLKFVEAHEFVDSSKVGCIGASYGGFMTMLLVSQTDLFTCAISHAGISSISSYWGEGYWGYIYSTRATAGSYPWNRKDIYVDQSALFNADKINTPLLLLHGSKDTNVPLGESLQLWVGLKILGKPVAMVQVEGEDHWILTYSKRIEWHNTIMAWFDKWLKDDGHDWKKLFPDSQL
jgi:dipeptidyl aminopeptidase/acylaminoacyl peptidase